MTRTDRSVHHNKRQRNTISGGYCTIYFQIWKLLECIPVFYWRILNWRNCIKPKDQVRCPISIDIVTVTIYFKLSSIILLFYYLEQNQRYWLLIKFQAVLEAHENISCYSLQAIMILRYHLKTKFAWRTRMWWPPSVLRMKYDGQMGTFKNFENFHSMDRVFDVLIYQAAACSTHCYHFSHLIDIVHSHNRSQTKKNTKRDVGRNDVFFLFTIKESTYR